MPLVVTKLRTNDTGPAVTTLHNSLGVLGATVSATETARSILGQTTAAAVVAFRTRYGLPQVSRTAPIVDAPTNALIQVAATFAASTDRTALKSSVTDALKSADSSQPQVLYWLARYSILAGDYATADSIARRTPALEEVITLVNAVLTLGEPHPRQPELPHPENFYTYREDLVDPATLDQMVSDMASVTKEQYAADLSTPGHTFSPDDIEQFRLDAATSMGRPALAAIAAWQTGNRHAANREFKLALDSYAKCQSAVADYLDKFFGVPTQGPAQERLQSSLSWMSQGGREGSATWNELRWRRILLSLQELEEQDRDKLIGTDGAFNSAGNFLTAFLFAWADVDLSSRPKNQDERLNTFMFVLGTIWVPLARGEVNCQLRQFETAIQEFADIKTSQEKLDPNFRYLCEFIEVPFIRLLTVETLLNKADAQYKAGSTAEARATYESVLSFISDDGNYVARVQEGRDNLVASIQQHLQSNDTASRGFQTLGKEITVPTIVPATKTLPGMDRTLGPHQSLATIVSPNGLAMRETNPRVYAMALTATAKLEQIKAGFNYLGYPDDYVPPWRFQFLLDRARYFTEHAKNAERDYLNFVNNAEHEEFQELSASQNVEMEKSNVRIESTKVEQAQSELVAASRSADHATLVATDAQTRLGTYEEFAAAAADADSDSLISSIVGSVVEFAAGVATGNPALAVQGGVGFGEAVTGGSARNVASSSQRSYEMVNLDLATDEAVSASKVAAAQLNVASAVLMVASLQLQAALLRHEFAVENLTYLRNRALSSEQWFRLANAIRSVSDTYLRYAIELAFLAEQAYEFEADKRINVIRFDYDQSEVGAYLAGDFLLRDLDTIEQDLIVNQRERQQQVRYVLSMAREFPAALQELRENRKVTFSLRLEQIERRFPGLYNARIGQVDLMPVALMDSTRFSLDLTHMGSGQLRLKAQPDTPGGVPSTSPPNVNDVPVAADGWLAGQEDQWPVKIMVTGPETTVYSGLARQDATAAFPVASAGQRYAFEGRSVAGGWQIDMSSRENQFVSGSLADMLITFTLSGYYDADLRTAVEDAEIKPEAITSFLSAQQLYPDAFYDFNRTGRMVWKVQRELLTLNGTLGKLRNIGMRLAPAPLRVHFGRLLSRLQIDFTVADNGQINVLGELPQFSLQQTAPLTVLASTAGIENASWDFGDGTAIVDSLTPAPHVYAKPGRYIVTLRSERISRLSEFRSAVTVSRSRVLGGPLVPQLKVKPDATNPKTLVATLSNPTAEVGRVYWRIGQDATTNETATFDLKDFKPGSYTLEFAAVRRLNFRAYCRQRYAPDQTPLALTGLSATTNRTFDSEEVETSTTPRNELAKALFDRGEISPEDDWTLELQVTEVLGISDAQGLTTEELDLSEIQDAILILEYENTAN